VLISGAAGGVGSAAVQLAHAVGAYVVATARAAEAHDRIRSFGADQVIVPDDVGGSGPYDVSLELVGSAGVVAALSEMATGGRIVVIGVGGGAKVDLNLLELMGRRATIGGSTLRARSVEEKAEAARAVEALVVPLLASGEISVPVAMTFPMSEASAGYERFAAGGKVGKIVLLVD
jgi:NADPH:quinone reductase